MERQIDYTALPQHIAFIMDGNRRWSKQRNVSNRNGYVAGLDRMFEIIEQMSVIGIKYATFFAFSIENWNRSQDEVDMLMMMAGEVFTGRNQKRKFNHLIDKNIKFVAIGDLSRLPQNVIDGIADLTLKSAKNTGMLVQIAISYSGRNEIVATTKKIMRQSMDGKIEVENVTEEVFAKNLMTKDVPDPDLLVRTGNEYRISNFLLWQISYCELYFCVKMWPDFSSIDLLDSIVDYQLRERCYGTSRKSIS